MSAPTQIKCEKFFRGLSKMSSPVWEKVATQCGFVSDEIKTIKEDNDQVEERSFEFLVQLRNRCPYLMDWSDKLRKGLGFVDRNDLVEELKKFVTKVTQQDAMGEDNSDSEPSSTSSTPKRESVGDVSVLRDLQNEMTPHQNLNNTKSKPEGKTAKKSQKLHRRNVGEKCKKRLQSDDKENTPGSPNTKKMKKEKAKLQPVSPPTDDLKLISEIRKEEGCSSRWYIEPWLDYMTKPADSNRPQKGKNNYNFHCYLQDSSGVSIYTSFFRNMQKSCLPIFKMIKGSTRDKPIRLKCLIVKNQPSEQLYQAGKSNYRLICNSKSSVMKV